MGTEQNIATLIPGRSFDVDNAGNITSLTRRYQVLRAPGQSIATLEVAAISGLPAMGEAHPNQDGLTAQAYRVSEDTNAMRWTIEVVYSASSLQQNWLNLAPRGAAEQSRGWDTQDINVDLTHDAVSGEAVLNAAGDPFESVPQVPRACPVFRLVRKENTSPATRLALSGTVNSSATTIDGVTVPKHAGRLSVSGRKLYLDPDKYAYEYTYTVTLMSNKIGSTDIGWDRAFVEAGLFYKEAGGTKVRAQEIDSETKQPRPRATPVLLKADGTLNATGTPVNKTVAAIPEASWGSLLS